MARKNLNFFGVFIYANFYLLWGNEKLLLFWTLIIYVDKILISLCKTGNERQRANIFETCKSNFEMLFNLDTAAATTTT